MTDLLINLNNAYHASQVMLDIQSSFIKLHHANDYNIFIDDLKKALDDYEKPFTLNNNHDEMTKLDKYLYDLLKATRNIFNILNDEGKSFVTAYLKG